MKINTQVNARPYEITVEGVKYIVLNSRMVPESGNTVYTVRRLRGERRYALFADSRGTFFGLSPLRATNKQKADAEFRRAFTPNKYGELA